MTIDEAIEDLKRIVNYEARNGYDRFAEFLSQILKWLEELKAKRNIGEWAYKQGYNKAIDDFAEILLKHKSKDEYPIMVFDEFTIKKFAEQLKDGKNDNR